MDDVDRTRASENTPLLPDGAAYGRWWERSADSQRIDCLLCPRKCSLKPGDRGFCFVRENRGGEMALSTYGRSTGFCIDPIEKKPLNHFFPGTSVLSFGTAGCNLGCKFCQNWDISKSREIERLSAVALPDQIAEAAVQTGCRSVAYTYNDPVIWAEYAIDTAKACRDRDILSVAVTAGYICDAPRREFFQWMDAANVDLKAFTEDFYQKITYAHLQPVLDTIRYVKHETNVWLELTNLIIPRTNDSSGEMRKMCHWVLEAVGDCVPVHFTAFHPDFRMQDLPRTDPDTLNRAYEIAKSAGIRFPYVGNVHDVQRQSTYCHHCGGLLIERDWYTLGTYNLTPQGRCGDCQVALAGQFADAPGTWGNQRQPIRIENYTPVALPAKHSGAMDNPSITSPSNSTTRHVPVAIDGRRAGHNPEETNSMSTDTNASGSRPTLSPASAAAQGPLPIASLTQAQRTAIAKTAASWTAQAVTGEPIKTSAGELGEMAQRIVMGVFVTLHRGEVLRGCCGVLGKPMPLLGAVTSAATRTAKEDNRFAPISRSELKHLKIDVTLLGPFQPIAAQGEERIEAVEVGKHGLMIQKGEKSGLLLPSVATQRGWNAKQFLEAVCVKASLRSSAWLDADVKLMRFVGEPMGGTIGELLEVLPSETIADPISNQELTAYAQLAGQNIVAIASGGTPSYVAPHLSDMSVNAIVLSMQWTREGEQAEKRQGNALQVSLRPGVPLQSTLFQMCQRAAQMFQQERFVGQLQIGLTLGFDPAQHGWGLKADLEGLEPKHRGLVISDAAHCGFGFNPSQSASELRDVLRRNLPIGSRDATVHSMHIVSTMPDVISVSGPTPVFGKGGRPAAVSGKFYPAEDAARRAMTKSLLSQETIEQFSPLAVMVPHAGLKFSGKIAAQVWQRIADLDGRTLIVVSPKHTRVGVNWSVCPFDTWQLSKTAEFQSDPELIKQLTSQVTPLQLDAVAHTREHGIEVQLPILEQLAPSARVVGLALQGGSWEDIAAAATEMATVIQAQAKPPLLVISSDMNHYAADEENRRRDRLALDALATGDPQTLLKACTENDISMCGVVPAMFVMQTLRELGQSFRVVETGYATSGEVNSDKSQVVGYAGALLLSSD